jgi:hypothetical protein
MIRADLEVSTGVYETIKTYSKIVFEDSLNGTAYFDITMEGNGTTYRNTYAAGKSVFIYKDSTLLCKGIILRRGFTSTGQLRLEGVGKPEYHLKVAAPSKNWSSTNTSGVISGAGNLLSRTTYVTAGTIANQTVSSFRSKEDESVLQAITRLTKLTGQDYYFNYSTMTLNIVNHRGSTTSVANLVDGVDIKGVVVNEDEFEVIKKVIVIGKGYGVNQIVGSYSSGWVQGDQEKVVIDKAVNTTTEANNLAQKYYNIYSQNRVDYTFEYIGIDDFTTGDVITLNSDVAGVYNTDLRITKQKFIATKNEEMIYLTVRGTSERENADDYLKKLLEVRKSNSEISSFNQPVDTAAVSVSVTGGILDAPSNTDINGAVSSAGSGDTGYYAGVYTRSLINDDTWRSVGTSINVGSDYYMFHGIWANFRITSIANFSPVFEVSVRAYNTTLDEYYPYGGNGIYIRVPGSLLSISHYHTVTVGGTNYDTSDEEPSQWFTYTIPFYLHIPMNWTNTNYILQYKLNLAVTASTAYLDYSYHGNEGHTHDDSFGTDDYDHGHGDNLAGTAADHTHGNT